MTNLQNTKDALICMSVTLQKIVKLYETTEADICKNMPSKEILFLRKIITNKNILLRDSYGKL